MEILNYNKTKWINRKEPLFIKEVKLPDNLIGWIVIDSIGTGYSSGGIRLGKKVSLEEVKLLANEMTLKRSFYNQPIGGAKAGIYCPHPSDNLSREEIFKNFGNALKPLIESKIYSPGTDMGTTQKDIKHLFEGAGINKVYDNDVIDSSFFTAISIFSALKALCLFNDLNLKGMRLGIQGLGKVGLKLLEFATKHEMKLVAGSTQYGALYSTEGLDVNRMLDLSRKYGDKFVNYYDKNDKISLEEFFEKDMDVLCPCAGIYPINSKNIDRIMAKIIVSGCNVAATEKIEKQLYKKGIAYLPGYVCNAGGVLGYTLKKFGIESNERSSFLSQGIQNRVNYLLRQSEKLGQAPSYIARSIVRQNQEKFASESQARLKGRLSVLIVRWRNDGIAAILRTIFWKFGKHKPISSNYIRKHLARKIAFNQLFKN